MGGGSRPLVAAQNVSFFMVPISTRLEGVALRKTNLQMILQNLYNYYVNDFKATRVFFKSKNKISA